MIVPMKKVTVVVRESDARAAVQSLRKTGVVHVEHHRAPQGDDIANLQERAGLVAGALAVLKAHVPQQRQAAQAGPLDPGWESKARHIVDLGKRAEQLESFARALQAQVDAWAPWGDFSLRTIGELRGRGVRVKLYKLTRRQMYAFGEGVALRVVNTEGGFLYCVALAAHDFTGPVKEIALPTQDPQTMRARIREDAALLENIRGQLKSSAALFAEFLAAAAMIEKQLAFARVLAGMGMTRGLAYVTGYVPQPSVAELQTLAAQEQWALRVEEPGEHDAVPTLLKNPRWVDLISPVFKLLEIFPGYREFDISPVFLIFLSLFFGMIIGDAGYGAVYFALTFFFHRKFASKKTDARVFYLFYLFSSCAILWGILTGTVFGQEWYLEAGLRPLIPALNDTKVLQTFCFFVGAFHLTLAQAWQGARKLPSWSALSDAGWIAVLWAAFFIARTLILDAPFPPAGKPLLVAGISLVIVFTSPQKNLLKAVGAGLGAVALNLMNNFTDVVSYVRLFAVGLAGVAIADTVNSLAAGFGSNAVVAAVIVCIGHTINIILGPMSVLVHGIRLNVLEFSGHAGLAWSGVAYKPLKE
jgi:V/A-type H+-transporting ATPase subunit I